MSDTQPDIPSEKSDSTIESDRNAATTEESSKWSSHLKLLFSGMSGVSALAVTLLAFYGAFFTTLPEQLIGQLRSDVTLAQSEAATAISEAEVAETRLDDARTQLDRASKDLVGVRDETMRLASDRDRLIVGIAELEHESNKLASELAAIASRRAMDEVDFILWEAAHRASQAAQLVEFVHWIASEPPTYEKDGETYYVDHGFFSGPVREWFDARPSSWEHESTRYNSLLMTRSSAAEYMERPEHDDFDEEAQLARFRAGLTRLQSGSDKPTGARIIRVVMSREIEKVLHGRHLKNFQSRLEKGLNGCGAVLNAPIEVRVSMDNTDEDIAHEGRRVGDEILAMQKCLPALRDSLGLRENIEK